MGVNNSSQNQQRLTISQMGRQRLNRQDLTKLCVSYEPLDSMSYLEMYLFNNQTGLCVGKPIQRMEEASRAANKKQE